MKLKYYLRGIGVGMILAVIVYSTIIIPRKYKMTDEEIKDRAQELGMVQREETDVDLSALTGTPSPTGEDAITPPPDVTGEAQGTPTAAPDEPDAPNPPGAITPPPSPSAAEPPEAVTPQATVTPEASTLPPPETDTPVDTPSIPSQDGGISLKITAGMESIDVAREAFQAGLIDDVWAFDQFLTQNGYDMTIRIGTFSVPEGATYEEIAKIVTLQ